MTSEVLSGRWIRSTSSINLSLLSRCESVRGAVPKRNPKNGSAHKITDLAALLPWRWAAARESPKLAV